MAIHGLKNIALAVGLLVIGSAGYAQPVPQSVPTTAPKLPTRPAPVSGKVAMDPVAVALRPATATPVVATSTARQVPPPSNPNEPLLKPEAEHAGAPHPAPAVAPSLAPSAAQGKPHADHTEGKKLPAATTGRKKVSKLPGHAHVDKTGAAGHRKKRGSKGKAEKVAQADTKQAHGVAATKHGKAAAAKAHAKAHMPKDKAAKADHDAAPHAAAHHAKAAASAPTVSTARELKADAHIKHAAKKGAHKAGAHHAKVVAKAASQSDHVSALKPVVKQKKKAPSAHVPA